MKTGSFPHLRLCGMDRSGCLRFLFSLLSLGLGAGAVYPSADYGPAVDRMITGCTKWYTSGYGHKFVVIHDMEGYYLTGISWLRRCDVTASAHYCVNGLKDYSQGRRI